MVAPDTRALRRGGRGWTHILLLAYVSVAPCRHAAKSDGYIIQLGLSVMPCMNCDGTC